MKTYGNSQKYMLALAILATLGVAIGIQPAHAADTAYSEWNGSQTGTDNWDTAASWTPNTVPSTSRSAKFDLTFTNQPEYGTNLTYVQGIWVATGVNQTVSITASQSRRFFITGTATLSGQANAGIIIDDTANYGLTFGNNTLPEISNDTGFYVNNAATLNFAYLTNYNVSLQTHTLTLGGTGSGTIDIRALNQATNGAIVSSEVGGSPSNGAGAIIINFTGVTPGTVNIGGHNEFTSGATLTAGLLNFDIANVNGQLAAAQPLGTGTFTINGGTIDNISPGGAVTMISDPIAIGGNFAFTGTQSLNLGAGTVNLGGATRTITAKASTLTFGGVLSNGGLTKSGAGILALTNAANTYAGMTTITGGTLDISAATANNIATSSEILVGDTSSDSSAILHVSSSGFHVVSAQTLAGFGNVHGAVTVNSGAYLAPGNSSLGTLTFNNTLALGGANDFDISQNGATLTSDLATGITTLTYGGTLDINNAGPNPVSSFVSGDSWTLFSHTVSESGTFANNSVFGTSGDGTTLPMLNPGLTWAFNYGTGVLSVQGSAVVPEPASLALLGLGALGLLARRRA